jgi:hypothetical protein
MEMSSLDIIMDDASRVQELDTREEKVKPFAGFRLFDFYRNQCWEVGPTLAIR